MNRPIWCKSKLLLLCFLPVFLCFFAGCGADNKSCIRWVTWKGYMGYSTKLRERMEAAGFDELLADVQEQINEWFASGH